MPPAPSPAGEAASDSDKKKAPAAGNKQKKVYVSLDDFSNSEKEEDKKKQPEKPAVTPPPADANKSPAEPDKDKEKDKLKENADDKKPTEYVRLGQVDDFFEEESDKECKAPSKERTKESREPIAETPKRNSPSPKKSGSSKTPSSGEEKNVNDPPKPHKHKCNKNKKKKKHQDMASNNNRSKSDRSDNVGNFAADNEIIVYTAVAQHGNNFAAACLIPTAQGKDYPTVRKLTPAVRDLGHADLMALQIALRLLAKKNPKNLPVVIRSDFARFNAKRAKTDPAYGHEYNELRALSQSEEVSKVSFEQVVFEPALSKHRKARHMAEKHLGVVNNPGSMELDHSAERNPKRKGGKEKCKRVHIEGISDQENNNNDKEPEIIVYTVALMDRKEASVGAWFGHGHKLNFSRQIPDVRDQAVADVIAVQMTLRHLKKKSVKCPRSVVVRSSFQNISDRNRIMTDSCFSIEFGELKILSKSFGDGVIFEEALKHTHEYMEAEKLARSELGKSRPKEGDHQRPQTPRRNKK